MIKQLISWDIYQITTQHTNIHGVMLRGRIRKFGLEKGVNVLCDNAVDANNCVRFAVVHGETAEEFINYLKSIIYDVNVDCVAVAVKNPVLSKLKVNNADRYNL